MTSARLLTVAILAACASVPAASQAAPIETLVEAERAFAAAAASDGVRDAFLRYAAGDGVIFRPGPVNARELWGSRPAASFGLAWYPSAAESSASGDLGYTTGPYETRDSAGAPTGHGWYVTVWRDEGSGWRFVADLGTPAPKPETPPRPWPRPALILWDPRPPSAGPGALDSLRAADRAFVAAAGERGFAAALEERGRDDVRLHRPGAAPAEGRRAAVALAARDPRRYAADSREAHVSRAGDFGYTVGEYRLRDESGNGRHETGWYLRIWRRYDSGWRVVLDVVSPRPPEREE